MFTNEISKSDFLTAMTGAEAAPMDISASYFTQGKTVRLFALRHEPGHHAVAPFTRPQLVKSVWHLLEVPAGGRISIYDIGNRPAMYLNDLASKFPSLVVDVARSGKKAFAIVKAIDRTSDDATTFWNVYDGNDTLPSRAR